MNKIYIVSLFSFIFFSVYADMGDLCSFVVRARDGEGNECIAIVPESEITEKAEYSIPEELFIYDQYLWESIQMSLEALRSSCPTVRNFVIPHQEYSVACTWQDGVEAKKCVMRLNPSWSIEGCMCVPASVCDEGLKRCIQNLADQCCNDEVLRSLLEIIEQYDLAYEEQSASYQLPSWAKKVGVACFKTYITCKGYATRCWNSVHDIFVRN